MSEISVSQIISALSGTGLSYSAMSWSGFNVFGDTASIGEVRSIVDSSVMAEAILAALTDANREIAAIKQQRDDLLAACKQVLAGLDLNIISALPMRNFRCCVCCVPLSPRLRAAECPPSQSPQNGL